MTRILLVEDEESYRAPLAYRLEKDGYEVIEAATGTEAVELFADRGADLVLLDLMLPGLDGVQVCQELRRTSDVPVIMVTAKDEEIDKVVGLEVGADDYVTKPYSYRELLARIRAVLRRRGPAGGSGGAGAELDLDDDENLVVGRIQLDVGRHEVRVDGAVVPMPLREFELLELLLRNPDRVLTRGQLIDRIWGADYVGDTKTLDVHIKRLRAKVEEDPGEPRTIVTVRGLGYKLVGR
ncbi:two-component system response regulator RegX3 [Salana multivorans]|uniref:Sensory transduction protein RegX3 n=1 Tax=Salana multivorans TaxID=120377 RepID=A0A3N2D8L3_9MICO|nr:response regulator transcription factor [Salana multivorans]ROR96126.1 two-component system response regulator RegX3 [Salana multivorans]